MKTAKILTQLLALVMLLAFAGCNDSTNAAPNVSSDSEIITAAETLMWDGHEVFWWYHTDWPDSLDIDEDEAARIQGDWQSYAKVGRFGTMAELKAATEAVFTTEFCEEHFYDKINNNQKYHEIDGVLYTNLQSGGMGWIFSLPRECILKTVDGKTATLTVICDGLDARVSTGESTEYEFELILKSVGGEWRLDSWYSYSPEGWNAIEMTYRDEA